MLDDPVTRNGAGDGVGRARQGVAVYHVRKFPVEPRPGEPLPVSL